MGERTGLTADDVRVRDPVVPRRGSGIPSCRCASGASGWSTPVGRARPGRSSGTGAGCRQPTRPRSASELAAAGAPGTPAGRGVGLAAPTILEHGSDDLKRRLPAPDRDRAPIGGASCSASPATGLTSPGSSPAPTATATSGSSTGRSCGTRAPTMPSTACSSPAPTGTPRSTAASRTSRSTCANPVSRCARCAR